MKFLKFVTHTVSVDHWIWLKQERCITNIQHFYPLVESIGRVEFSCPADRLLLDASRWRYNLCDMY